MRRLFFPYRRRLAFPAAAAAMALLVCAASGNAGAGTASGHARITVVGFRSRAALLRAVAGSDARVVRMIPALHAAVVRTPPAAVALLDRARGIRYAEPALPREALAEPALATDPGSGDPYEWQYAATGEDLVPDAVRQASSKITIAVIDSGADVTAPDLAAKSPVTWSVLSGTTDVSDPVGHGTFVSSLAAGSWSNDDGVAGFGGDAKLLVVQAGDSGFSSADLANALVYAVNNGAKVINLSLGGQGFSSVEEDAIDYAVAHGTLIVAAAGNSGNAGNPPIYPAAYLQPLGSNGVGGVGLAVSATDVNSARASFSSYGSYISLAAPGENVFGAISSESDPAEWPDTPLPGSTAGSYGYSSGTSFAAPEVAGAAALVWAANPLLSPPEVADVLKQTASGNGTWNPDTGYGVLNVAAAVARAQSISATAPSVSLSGTRTGNHVRLSWSAPNATHYRLQVVRDGGAPQVLLGATTETSTASDLDPGHTYSFSVTATMPWGAAYTSPAYDVALPYSPATVTLRATRLGGRTSRTVRLWASFSPAGAGVGRAGRVIALDAFNGRTWRRFASATTNSTGLATWTGRVRHGTYLLRAVYGGAVDVAAATSPSVRFRAR